MASWLLALVLASSQTGGDVVVVCPPDFREALTPWIVYRQNQGHQVVVVSNLGTAEEVRQRIRQVAAGGTLRFVMLVGDALPTRSESPTVQARCVPVHWAEAEVNVAWGSEPHLGTDNWYADLNDDQVPDVAIGRLTVDTPQELSRLVARILAYEHSNSFGLWRRQMNFVAGIGGFGLLTDWVVESAARYFLSQEIPAAYVVTMTYGSWRSPYCPDPRQFRATTLQRLNEGCQFWVYLGHGQPLGLDWISVPDGHYPILSVDDVGQLDGAARPPIALLLACYTGAVDAREDCLAEQMLRAEGGPIAVLAGSRMTMPYGNAVWATELLRWAIREPSATLGEAVLRAKQEMLAEPQQKGEARRTLDTLAAALSPAPAKLAVERREHVLLYNLLGDPLLRLSPPKPVEVTVASAAEAEPVLEVHGTCPLDGQATIELAVPRDRLTFDPPPRPSYPQGSDELARFQEIYRRANDQRVASSTATVEGGQFQTRLPIPEGACGVYHVRVFVEGQGDFALGALEVKLPAPGASTPSSPSTPEVSRQARDGGLTR